MEEFWKDIKGLEGQYQVSNLGRIKSLQRTADHWRGGQRLVHEKILKPGRDKRGYLKMWSKLTHRIVAETFIPNPENKRTVNHINGIKTDNRVENLEWATDEENMRHSFANGLHKAKKGELNGRSKLKEQNIYVIKKMLNDNVTHKEIAKKFNVSRGLITRISNGLSWKHAA